MLRGSGIDRKQMDTTDEEDENGDGASSCHHHKNRERDSLEDLRVRRRKSAVLCTVINDS